MQGLAAASHTQHANAAQLSPTPESNHHHCPVGESKTKSILPCEALQQLCTNGTCANGTSCVNGLPDTTNSARALLVPGMIEHAWVDAFHETGVKGRQLLGCAIQSTLLPRQETNILSTVLQRSAHMAHTAVQHTTKQQDRAAQRATMQSTTQLHQGYRQMLSRKAWQRSTPPTNRRPGCYQSIKQSRGVIGSASDSCCMGTQAQAPVKRF